MARAARRLAALVATGMKAIPIAWLLAVCPQAASVSAAQALPADARVTLERTGCAGECPVFTVSLDADGTVTFDGRAHVLATGRHTRQIAPAQVRSLLDEAERIGFFQLAERYASRPDAGERATTFVDVPAAIVTVTRGGETRRVHDLLGAPESLRAFERHIETVTQTRTWLRLDVATLQALVRDHQRPGPADLVTHLRTALEHDDVDVIEALLALGAEANAVDAGRGVPLLMLARSPAATQLLLNAGANPLITSENGVTPLWRAALGPAAIVRLLLRAGVPVDQPVDEDSRTALWHAACHGNVDVVTLLLGAGANPAVRFDGLTAVDCARNARTQPRDLSLLPFATPPSFDQDFDGTIRALQQALAPRASQP